MIQKSFDEIYQIVEESSHETAFNREECLALHDLCRQLKKESIVVEIGVQFGRSTSVIAEVQKEIGYHFLAIDNWSESNNAKEHIENQRQKHEWNFDMITGDSSIVGMSFGLVADLIHIDGDHNYWPVLEDCQVWLPKLKQFGYVCFDDYEHEGLEEVTKAVQYYMNSIEGKKLNFRYIGKYGNKLAVFQRMS